MGCLEPTSATKWLLKTCFLWLALHAKLSLQQDVAGLLCISECATCPTLCSPPPPPSSPKKSPPLPIPSPPSETYVQSSPPPPPPPSPAAPKKSSSSSASPPPPPSWFYFTAPSLPPPPEKSNSPPPTRPGVTVVTPTNPAARDNSNPYNYFVYASHAVASSSVPRSFIFFLTFLFHVVLWYSH